MFQGLINPTNVCEANCSFCGFKRKSGQEGAYTMHEEELLEYVVFNTSLIGILVRSAESVPAAGSCNHVVW